jgi:hypothetical protein
MLIDLRIEPECKKGTRCESCGEPIQFPDTLCQCGTEITWINRKGIQVGTYKPTTVGAKYAFTLFRTKYYQSKAEMKLWQKLERKHGEKSIIKKATWAHRKGMRGRHALGVVKNLLLGESDGESGFDSRETEGTYSEFRNRPVF